MVRNMGVLGGFGFNLCILLFTWMKNQVLSCFFPLGRAGRRKPVYLVRDLYRLGHEPGIGPVFFGFGPDYSCN